MSTGTTLRPSVLAAKAALADGREKLRTQHDHGSPGIQVCAKLTDLADTVLNDLIDAALEDLAEQHTVDRELIEQHVALVAHGGYGRRELAPYSDIDLMILHTPAVDKDVESVAERLIRDIFDAGLMLGQSVRTPRQALTLASQDPQILTSLTESRHLAGNQELTQRLLQRLRRTSARRAKSLLPAIEASRREERRQYGETVYLLEPNIKRSRGGLRDIQFLRWIGFVCYGTTDPDGLCLSGVLEEEEKIKLLEAREFLLRTRNEVHFHADKAYDRLDRPEQVRLADWYGYQGEENGLHPAEQFMQEYFRHTRAVRYISGRFLSNAYRSSRFAGIVGALISHRAERDFRVGPYRIVATRRGMEMLRHDLSEVMRLAELATLYDKRIGHETWEAVRRGAAQASDAISKETAERFMSLLARPPQLYRILNRLHELGVLEKLIPAFRRARGLLQFNQYHKYTVDEHCLRAVQRATEFSADPGPLGRVYKSIKDKQILHLALLLHDLGKGYTEDHSIVGLRIATATAALLQLSARDTETLEFLVHEHLLMTHLALWRDLNDPAVVVQLAVKVGSPEVLQMLYVLSAADLGSVGPGVLNDWKTDLLTQLFERTMDHLSGESAVTGDTERLKRRRQAVTACLGDISDRSWFAEQICALPPAFLLGTPAEHIADALSRLHDLQPDEVIAWGTCDEEQKVIEFTVGTHETITPGIFHKLTGALTSEGAQILSAQINTLSRGLVLDRFHVVDPDFSGPPPAERIESISNRLVEVLKSAEAQPPAFRQRWQGKSTDMTSLAALPTKVAYDNTTSERSTILEIFAADRTGLLYRITRTLFELGLSVNAAKIGTHLDQVVDVFYVTTDQGTKIKDHTRLESIRKRLLEAIDGSDQD